MIDGGFFQQMQRRFQLSVALIIGAALLYSAPVFAAENDFYISDDEITIDNQITEEAWGDPIITDGEDDPDRTQYCWNTSTADWLAILDSTSCTTYLYDEEGQIDILEAWFGVNESNMLLAFETASPMFAIKDVQADEYLEIYSYQTLAELGIDHLPNEEGFSHDMVFSFDTDVVEGEESYDWYMVANIDYNLPMEEVDQEDFLQIFQESGETDGFQADEDTFVDNIDTSNSESGDVSSGGVSAVMEIRQNIEYFYEQTGIQVGDEVGFRLETHSLSGDTTEQVLVQFVDAEDNELLVPNKPRGLRAIKKKATSVRLQWRAPKNTVPATYTTQLRTLKDTDSENWTTLDGVEVRYVSVKQLHANTVYQFRVKACNADEECSSFTKWKRFKTKKN